MNEKFQVIVQGRAGCCIAAPIQVNTFDTQDEAKVAAELAGYNEEEYRIVGKDAHLDAMLFKEDLKEGGDDNEEETE